MGIKLYFAGLAASHSEMVDTGLIDNAFVSYYYILVKKKGRFVPVVRQHTKSLIVDSGAHSFFSETPKARLSASHVQKKSQNPYKGDEYFEYYLTWLEEHKAMYDYFVELDIGELVGQKRVVEWREILKKKGLFDKCITVHHPEAISRADYIRMLEESASRYVALEGDRRYRARLPYLELIKEGYKRGVRIHGFALIKREVLEKHPFYSTDASSWKVPVTFGKLPFWTKDNRLRLMYIKRSGPSSGRKTETVAGLIQMIERGYPISKVLSPNRAEQVHQRLLLSIYGYNIVATYYTDLWKARGVDWEAAIE